MIEIELKLPVNYNNKNSIEYVHWQFKSTYSVNIITEDDDGGAQ
jgi:hypothetical protein